MRSEGGEPPLSYLGSQFGRSPRGLPRLPIIGEFLPSLPGLPEASGSFAQLADVTIVDRFRAVREANQSAFEYECTNQAVGVLGDLYAGRLGSSRLWLGQRQSVWERVIGNPWSFRVRRAEFRFRV